MYGKQWGAEVGDVKGDPSFHRADLRWSLRDVELEMVGDVAGVEREALVRD